MKVAVLRERAPGESRVAATPETVGKLVGLGARVAVEAGAGAQARFADSDYAAAGAAVAASAAEAVAGADILLAVRRPSAAILSGAAPGALVVGALDPFGNEAEIAELARAGVTAIAMEFMPRITRAQVMDILSSQANLAGYQAVIEAAAAFERALPMMMTAAGTVRPAKVFVMGAGVAGLQAIATARRLGAVVSATDVRPAAKEQVESLGGKFIAVEDEEFRQAETAGGYAKEMSAEYRDKQAALIASHIAKQDIVITTALIPGRPAPRLVSRAMVEAMAPGSVIVDLAAERGGNVELTKPGAIIERNGVKILGLTNMQGRIPTTASQLYARNLLAFVDTLLDKQTKALALDWEDELLKATVLTRGGTVVHPAVRAPEPAPGGTAAAGAGTVAEAGAQPVPVEKPADRVVPAAPVKGGAARKGRAKPAAAETPTEPVTVPAMAATPVPPAEKPARRSRVRSAAPTDAVSPDAAAKPRTSRTRKPVSKEPQ